jgi:hypothetical protein
VKRHRAHAQSDEFRRARARGRVLSLAAQRSSALLVGIADMPVESAFLASEHVVCQCAFCPLDSVWAPRSRHKRRIWNSGFGLKKKFLKSSPEAVSRLVRTTNPLESTPDDSQNGLCFAVRGPAQPPMWRREGEIRIAAWLEVPDTCARTSPPAKNVGLGRLAGSLLLKAAQI